VLVVLVVVEQVRLTVVLALQVLLIQVVAAVVAVETLDLQVQELLVVQGW
jgi:hypothetical protein